MGTRILFCILFLFSNAYRVAAQCPGIDFTASKNTVCAPGIITFYASGIPAGSSLRWELGNGPQPGGDTVSGIFTTPGNITIALTVTFADLTTCTITKNGYVQVVVQQIPQFEVSRNHLCNGTDTVTFTDKTAFSNSRTWIIGEDEYPNAAATIIHPFTSTGYFSVTLIVSDQYGCPPAILSMDSVVAVYDSVKVNFTTSQDSVCAPARINFTSSVTALNQSVSSYAWTFGGGNPATSAQQDPQQILFAAAGSYTVSLSITTDKNCTYTFAKNNFVTLGDSIIPAFSSNSPAPCNRAPVTLTNTTSPLTGTYTWTLPGGKVLAGSDQYTQYVQYLTPGVKSITLDRTNNGCRTSFTNATAIDVQAPLAKFTVQNPNACQLPHTVTFSSATSQLPPTGTNTYNWTFYDVNGTTVLGTSTQQHPTFLYTSLGNYTVQLVVSNSATGCADTAKLTNVVKIRKAAAAFKLAPANNCPGAQVTFTNETEALQSGTPNNYVWKLYDTDGVTILHTATTLHTSFVYNNTGTYDVELIVYNSLGCADTLRKVKVVTIANPAISYQLSDTDPCTWKTVTFTGNTTPASFGFTHQWLFTHVDSPAVSLAFTGNAVNRYFSVPGNYDLKLVVKSASGCKDSITVSNAVHVGGTRILATASSYSGCVPFATLLGSAVQVNEHPKNPGNAALAYAWRPVPTTGTTIDDDTAAATNATFAQKGSYTVSLVVTNADGCKDTFYLPQKIAVGVTAAFLLPAEACLQQTVDVRNVSALQPDDYQWSSVPAGVIFSPAAGSITPQLTFPDSGTYEIQLVAGKNSLCYDTTRKTIRIRMVTADFFTGDTLNFCAPVPVNFKSLSINADTLYWDFGDGRTRRSFGDSLTHIYTSNSGASAFDVKLRITSVLGCADSLTKTAYVKVIGPKPKFVMSNISGCEDLTVTFTDSSESYTNYLFDYGDGSPFNATGSPGSHTYRVSSVANEVEVYKPRLVVSDDFSCFSLYEPTDSIVVFKTPVANFSADSLTGCEPVLTRFTDSSLRATQYSWDFDNNGVTDATQPSPTRTFAAGTYTVKLKVTSQYGCTDSVIKQNHIESYPLPVADYTYQRIESDTANPVYIFQSTSSGNTSQQWYIDATPASSLPLFNHTFAGVQFYRVVLVAISDKGCTDSMSKLIEAIPGFYMDVPNAFTPDGNGLNESFGGFGIERVKTYNLQVLSRWGEMVFEADKVENRWDGRYKDQPCQEGIYLYQVQVIDLSGVGHRFKGNVYLKR